MKRKPKTPIDQPCQTVSCPPVPPHLKALVLAIDDIPGHQTIGFGEWGGIPFVMFDTDDTALGSLGLFKIQACVDKVAFDFKPPASPTIVFQQQLLTKDGSLQKVYRLHVGSTKAHKAVVSLLKAPSYWKEPMS